MSLVDTDNLVVRFAPSPTGTLHLGNARTALFNYVLARRHNGKMLLRIEDTDQERSSQESERSIMADLRWLGLDWDYGPDCPGDTPPYRQSEAGAYYQELFEQLRENEKIYPCFCSADVLAQKRETQRQAAQALGYDGTCRNVPTAEARRRLESGEPAVWRLRYPEDRDAVAFTDVVRGDVQFPFENLGGDMVLFRTDSSPTFHFAVVADDHRMGVTFVLRGEDHLANTAKQLLLFEALGWTPPQYGHMAMILGPDKTKLSKRHGGVTVQYYREKGVLSQALFNYVSLLGWSPGDDTEYMTPDEITARFSVERLVKSAAVFDEEKLLWLNGLHLRALPEDAFVTEAWGWLDENAKEMADKIDSALLSVVLPMFQEAIECFSQLPAELGMFVDGIIADTEQVQAVRGSEFFPDILGWFEANISTIPEGVDARNVWFNEAKQKLQAETGAKGKGLFQPIRLIISGQTSGRDLGKIFACMPISLIQARMEQLKST